MGEPIEVTNLLTGETRTVYSERFAQQLREEAQEQRDQLVAELTDLPKLTEEKAEALFALGITTQDELAQADPVDLSEIDGVGETLAAKWIEQAGS